MNTENKRAVMLLQNIKRKMTYSPLHDIPFLSDFGKFTCATVEVILHGIAQNNTQIVRELNMPQAKHCEDLSGKQVRFHRVL